ncbi:repeat 37 [Octopus vulgaris]|nr:repeat 37 [Octopus vulgaris]
MDNKEIKSKLKAAREALKNKNYEEAENICKVILDFDEKNYNALVFRAVANVETKHRDEAISFYKQAIEINPDQVLAWQGLCSFYEKNSSSNNKTELIPIYEKLQVLYESEKDKQLEVLKKYVSLCSELGFVEKAIPVYQKLVCLSGESSTESVKLLQDMSQLLNKHKEISEQYGNVLISNYRKALDNKDLPADDKKWLAANYIFSLLKNGDQEFLMSEISQLKDSDPDNSTVIEYCLLIELDSKIGYLVPSFDDSFKKLMEKLATIDESSAVLSICRGVYSILSKDYKMATEHFREGLERDPLLFCAHYYLSLSLYYLHDKNLVDKASNIGIKASQKKTGRLTVPVNQLTTGLYLLQAKMSMENTSLGVLNNMVKLLIDTESSNIEIQITLAYLYIKLEKYQEAEECVEELAESESAEVVALKGWLLFHQGNYEAALQKLLAAVSEYSENSKFLLMLGRIYWQLKDSHTDNQESSNYSEKSFKSFLQAAKLDPYNCEIFLYLGHFYLHVQQDKGKARKCYQKAFNLDPENSDVGAAFCDIMMDTGDVGDESVLEYLKSVTTKAGPGGAKWAWLRLGLKYLKNEDPNNAVISFQAALRPDPLDFHIWECLGEAYINRGSYTAALKAFTKVTELDAESVYSQYMIAFIKQILGLYSEAVTEYKVILEKEPDYVPALKGVGETLLLQAKSFISRFLDKRILDACEEAICYLTRAASQRPDLSCIWKMLGDACTILNVVDINNFRKLMVPCKLTTANAPNPESKISLHKISIMELGSKCYGKAIKCFPECSSLWHDLGVSFMYQTKEIEAMYLRKGQHKSMEVERKAQKAIEILKQAVTLDPQNFQHWNALGVAACTEVVFNPKLAQHCFSKAIQLDSNNVVPWTNLGALYLRNQNLLLAHEAFSVAQSLDPNYVTCWIGQAFIADTVGHDEAMDLFRHTTELGNHVESLIGYGHWVCSMLLDETKHDTSLYRYNIERMSVVPAACDALSKYTERIQDCAVAFNMYGLLLERHGLHSMAEKAFSRAIDLLEKEKNENSEFKLKVRCNLARILGTLGDFKGALDLYKIIGSDLDFGGTCGLALTLFKAGQFYESYQEYGKALQMTEEFDSQVMTAQAIALLNMGKINEAVKLLMTGSQMSVPSVEGLKALCAIALIRADHVLASAVVQELAKIEDPKGDHLADITWLCAAEFFAKDEVKAGCNYIRRTIQKYPWKASLWILLAKAIMWFAPEDTQMASTCVLYAQQLDESLNKDVAPILVQSLLAAGLHCARNGNRNGFSVAQKAYHVHPDDLNSMLNLIPGIHAGALIKQCVIDKAPDNLYFTEMMFLDHVLLELSDQISVSVQQWMWKLRCWCAMNIFSSLEELQIVWKQMLESSCFKEEKNFNTLAYIRTLEGVKLCDVDIVKEGVVQAGGLLSFWQILEEVSIKEGLLEDAEFIAGQCVNLAQSESAREGRLLPMIRLAMYSFKRLMKDLTCGYSLSMFEEAVKEVLELDPLCTTANLMYGIVEALKNKDSKAAPDFLKQVINDDKITGGLSFAASLARQHLLKLIHKKNNSDSEIKCLLADAHLYNDTHTIGVFKTLSVK